MDVKAYSDSCVVLKGGVAKLNFLYLALSCCKPNNCDFQQANGSNGEGNYFNSMYPYLKAFYTQSDKEIYSANYHK